MTDTPMGQQYRINEFWLQNILKICYDAIAVTVAKPSAIWKYNLLPGFMPTNKILPVGW